MINCFWLLFFNDVCANNWNEYEKYYITYWAEWNIHDEKDLENLEKKILNMNKSNQKFFRASAWHGVPLLPWRVHSGFWCRAGSWSSSAPEWCCWSHDSSLFSFFLCPWCLYESDHRFYRRKGSFKSRSLRFIHPWRFYGLIYVIAV